MTGTAIHNSSSPVNVFNEAEIDLRSLLLMFWRRRFIFAGLIVVALGLGILASAVIKPHYTARSIILLGVDSPQNSMKDLNVSVNAVRLDPALVLNELEILRSRNLARAVIERLSLMTDPEFNPRFEGAVSQELNDTGRGFRNFSVYGSELQTLPPEVIDDDLAGVIERFQNNLRVHSISGSFAIQIEFSARDASKAALIANKIADVYIEQRLEAKFKAAKKLTDWLNTRLVELREQVRAAEERAQQYRAERNLLDGKQSAISAEQLSALNAQLVLARTSKAEALARLEQIRNLGRDYKSIEALSELTDSGVVRELKLEEARLEAEISQLSSRYGEKHPEMIKRRSKIAELRNALRGEVTRLTKAVQSEVDFAQARVEALEEGLNEVTFQRHHDNEAMIRLRELEREAQAARLIFDTFLETYKRSDEQEKLQDAEAQIISYATVPQEPAFPDTRLIFALLILLAFFLSLIVSILFEKMDNSFRSATQLEHDLGFPCYALVPPVRKIPRAALSYYILDNPTSAVAEAVKTLRLVLNLRAKDGQTPRVVALTSSEPGEGKSTLSLWLGLRAASAGEKVIIIDADLRRPNLHIALDAHNQPALDEYLTSRKTLDQVIRKDKDTGADLIFSRPVPGEALDLISSGKMKTLIAELRQRYDLVIIDTPASLAVSDAQALATLADHMLYVVSWGKTSRDMVAGGVRQFADMNYKTLSFVFTNADLYKHRQYGYSDAAHYHSHYYERRKAA